MPGPAPEERPQPSGRRTPEGVRVDPEAAVSAEARTATLSVLVDHEPGVLSAVSGLFSRRRFNIESLTVGPTADPDHARITVVIEEPEPGIEQAKKQLAKLVPVVTVAELDDEATRRELALVKVDAGRPDEVAAVADMYDAEAVDASPEAITLEVTGRRRSVEAAIAAFERFGVREVKRTGTAALAGGAAPTTPDHVPQAPATDGGRAPTDRRDDADPPADASTDRPTTDSDSEFESDS
ncbi:MAG: acetolactate synthase small subunit [Halolamina sp.]